MRLLISFMHVFYCVLILQTRVGRHNQRERKSFTATRTATISDEKQDHDSQETVTVVDGKILFL
jgi:hypothetical protein